MDFLNNDLVRKAEATYGEEAENAAETEAEKYVGKDVATAAVGELGSVLGIPRPAAAQAAPTGGTADAAPADDATPSDDNS